MILNNKFRPADERIEIHEVRLENAHDWIVLKKTEKCRIGKYDHETAKADLYVALQGHVDSWMCEEKLAGGVLVPDLTMEYRGMKIYLEIDLGNMEPERLFSKVERYIQCAGPGEKVIFVLKDGKYKAGQIGSRLLEYCRERRLGNFITFVVFENLIDYPLGNILISPKEDGRISLGHLV